jgi:hypothetical protein
MRDIRTDLEERAALLENQINSAQAQFDKLVEQLKAEYASRLKHVKAEADAVRVLLGVEDRRLANGAAHANGATPSNGAGHANGAPAPKPQAQAQPAQSPQPRPEQAQVAQPAKVQAQPAAQQPQPPQPQAKPQPQQQLGDFLIRRLRERGPMAKDELRHLALQEGYFAEADNADGQLHATLAQVVTAGFARELPNGKFAPPSLLDTIRLRRAV